MHRKYSDGYGICTFVNCTIHMVFSTEYVLSYVITCYIVLIYVDVFMDTWTLGKSVVDVFCIKMFVFFL